MQRTDQLFAHLRVEIFKYGSGSIFRENSESNSATIARKVGNIVSDIDGREDIEFKFKTVEVFNFVEGNRSFLGQHGFT